MTSRSRSNGANGRRAKGGVISTIEPGSIADELGWRIGDEIISVNGHGLHDVIDYRFYSSDDLLRVVLRRGGERLEHEIEKDIDEPLGVEFRDILFDDVRLCGAKCVFCFVDQLPKGLRKSLYLKDDDYRLSFLDGNFITLANVAQEDLDRIIEQRLSPLYVSVHTTDSHLRQKILRRSCPDILGQIDTLAAGRITLHTQVVICRGINDGQYLDRTIEDLAARHSTVASIAIVPAGVTRQRRNKTPIPPINAQYSRAILYRVQQWQRRFLREKGTRLVWGADEFYVSAGRGVLRRAAYEEFPQLANGVGLVRLFRDSASYSRRLLRAIPDARCRIPSCSVVTGTLAAPLLREWAASVEKLVSGIVVHPVVNRLFGETVTVAGLLTGRDVIDQLREADRGDVLVVPSVALRDGAFLDDVTVGELESALGVRVIVVEPLPHRLVQGILALAGYSTKGGTRIPPLC